MVMILTIPVLHRYGFSYLCTALGFTGHYGALSVHGCLCWRRGTSIHFLAFLHIQGDLLLLVVCVAVTSVLTLTLRYLCTALSFSTHSGRLSFAGGLCWRHTMPIWYLRYLYTALNFTTRSGKLSLAGGLYWRWDTSSFTTHSGRLSLAGNLCWRWGSDWDNVSVQYVPWNLARFHGTLAIANATRTPEVKADPIQW